MVNVTRDAQGGSGTFWPGAPSVMESLHNTGGSGSYSWSHTVDPAATLLMVRICIDFGVPANFGTLTVQYNGVTMTRVATAQAGNQSQTSGFVASYALFSPPSGTHSVTVTGAVNDSFDGGSVSWFNAASLGTPVITDSALTLASSGTVTVPGSAPTSALIAVVGNGSGFAANTWFTTGTASYVGGGTAGGGNGCGCGADGAQVGGGAGAMHWNQNADWYGAIGLEIIATGGTPAPSGTAQPLPTVATPRRRPARAVWAAVRGSGRAAVPAPRQLPIPVPARRRPARAVVRGVAGPGNAVPPAPPVQLPPLPHPQPRRAPARAVVRGLAGPGNALPPVAVPAPGQGPPIARRRPARGQSRGTPVVTVNAHGSAVAAPGQLPRFPRRTPSRAFVRFTPVTTVNPAFIPVKVRPSEGEYDKTLTKRRMVWRMMGL